MADNEENGDRSLLETAVIVTVVLGAAVGWSCCWKMMTDISSHPAHASRQEKAATADDTHHGAAQRADPPHGT